MYEITIVRNNTLVLHRDGLTHQEVHQLKRQYRASGYQHFVSHYM